jgi:hypothetical protein
MAAAFRSSDFKHRRKQGGKVEYVGTKPLKLNGTTYQPGQLLQRRQYENLRYSAAGWTSKSEYERVSHGHMKNVPHEANAYRRFSLMYADEHGDENLRKVVGPNAAFSRAFVAAYRDNFEDMTSDGPFAKLLTVMGVRDAEATYNVGDTP